MRVQHAERWAMQASGQRYWQPRTLPECLRLMAEHPRATLLAGATAAQLGWPARRPWTQPASAVIDLQWLMRDAARDGVAWTEDGSETMLTLPALGSLESLRSSNMLMTHLPELPALLGQVASAGVRRLATLGGNLVWPSGDLRVPLQVLDVVYQVADPQSGEVNRHRVLPSCGLLMSVGILGIQRIDWLTVEKITFRAAFSPSLLTVAIAMIDQKIRIAVGGGVTPNQRLGQAEAAIDRGANANELMSAIRSELVSSDDALASRKERIEVAARCVAGHLRNRLGQNAGAR